MRAPDEIACSRRTIYSYIDRGVFQARNIDLRRKVVYKQRKRKTTASLKDRSFRKDRSYKEFLEYIAANKSVYVVEMDTVEGAKGTSPCFLTMFFRNCSLMLMFLLEEQTQKEVTRIFDHLTELLGIELFQKLFEVILTDNGHEFQDLILHQEIEIIVGIAFQPSEIAKGAVAKMMKYAHAFIIVIPTVLIKKVLLKRIMNI